MTFRLMMRERSNRSLALNASVKGGGAAFEGGGCMFFNALLEKLNLAPETTHPKFNTLSRKQLQLRERQLNIWSSVRSNGSTKQNVHFLLNSAIYECAAELNPNPVTLSGVTIEWYP